MFQIAPISTNLVLSYIGEHMLDMPRSFEGLFTLISLAKLLIFPKCMTSIFIGVSSLRGVKRRGNPGAAKPKAWIASLRSQ